MEQTQGTAATEKPTCPENPAHTLYYRRPYRDAPDTILDCRDCRAEADHLDRLLFTEPTDLYEE